MEEMILMAKQLRSRFNKSKKMTIDVTPTWMSIHRMAARMDDSQSKVRGYLMKELETPCEFMDKVNAAKKKGKKRVIITFKKDAPGKASVTEE